ncbi:uncharacterized protein Dana_GF14532, isoform C [Drosophila ananassae]|uniref:Uncharacterized protein, isoform C n=1 Tax=Drosophila ananassae TaxID=7217 RepID=B3MK61_DROAN|nr:rho-associated protein kinase 2 isoform X1 [Drosophila ananassae]EDV31479.2 uncharacterized protein Dana_GF14532, isoform C [Drosophila ananassae]
MSRRPQGFVLDNKSMGLCNPRPPSPCGTPKPSCSALAGKPQCQPQNLPQCQQSCQETIQLKDEGSASHAQCKVSMEPLCTDHYRCLLKKFRVSSGDSDKVNFELNNIFLKRLDEIDCLEDQGGDAMHSSQLRLVTFQEWVDFLLNVNHVILGNMSALEDEAYGKILTCFQSVQGEQQQSLEENRKLRKDICAIIKLVQNAYHRNCWQTEGIHLETLTIRQLLGVGKDQCLPESESEKMAECMKSLVNEMASKHDEVQHLKSQLCAQDEVVQTARQKLLLKDQCIAQLNQQLQEISQCLNTMTEQSTSKASQQEMEDEKAPNCPPVETSSDSDPLPKKMLTSLVVQERLERAECEMVRMLNAELSELFELHSKQEFKAVEDRQRNLACIIEQLNADRLDTQNKLNNIRSQLRILQEDIDQSCTCKSETEAEDPDTKLLDAVARRLLNLNSCNRELQAKLQRQDTDCKIKITELQAQFESENTLNIRNCDILKEIADLICKLRSTDFSYNEIYNETSTENPFCVAIMEMFDEKSEQTEKEYESLAANERLVCQISALKETLNDRNELINHLQSMIGNYSDMSENNRLKEENHDLKMKNSENIRKAREIAEQLNGQVTQRVELVNKYESLSSSFEEQCQELKGANRRVQSLQTRLCQVEKLQEELRTERKMLREEVIALKEKDACSVGRERALQDQLRCSQMDLDKSRCLIRNMQSQLQQQDKLHQDSIQDLKLANESIREQVRSIGSECQQMQQRLKQEAEVNRQQRQIIETFRKWKDAQVRADDVMRERFNRAEEHINMLLEENQTLAEDYRLLLRDHTVLESEMGRVKQAVNYSTSSTFGCPPGMERIEGGSDMARSLLRNMTDTSQRISDQCKTLITNANKMPQMNEKTLLARNTAGSGKQDSYNALRPTRSSNNLLLQ